MFLRDFFVRRQPRKFTFTPFYYTKEEDEHDESGPRIRFKRLRKGAPVSKKSVRGMVFLAIFLLFCLYYLWRAVEREVRSFKIESIRIEQVPSGY